MLGWLKREKHRPNIGLYNRPISSSWAEISGRSDARYLACTRYLYYPGKKILIPWHRDASYFASWDLKTNRWCWNNLTCLSTVLHTHFYSSNTCHNFTPMSEFILLLLIFDRPSLRFIDRKVRQSGLRDIMSRTYSSLGHVVWLALLFGGASHFCPFDSSVMAHDNVPNVPTNSHISQYFLIQKVLLSSRHITICPNQKERDFTMATANMGRPPADTSNQLIARSYSPRCSAPIQLPLQ